MPFLPDLQHALRADFSHQALRCQKSVMLLVAINLVVAFSVFLGALTNAWAVDLSKTPHLPKTLQQNDGKHVLVEFYAEWCGTCKMMAPYIQQLKHELRDDLRLVLIDVDKLANARYSRMYNIEGTPTYVLFKPDGTPVYSMQNYISYPVLRTQVRKALGKVQNTPVPAGVAKTQGKPWTLVSFHGERCKPCETDQPYLNFLQQQEVDNLQVLRLDPSNQLVARYMQQLKVKTVPTYVLLDAKGAETYRMTGQIKPKNLIRNVHMFAHDEW